jgi:hypothetical protein
MPAIPQAAENQGKDDIENSHDESLHFHLQSGGPI